MICDTGAGAYTSDYDLRYLQRSVRSHSTICIDGRGPNKLSARELFSLLGKRSTIGDIWELPDKMEILCKLALTYSLRPFHNITIQRIFQADRQGRYLHITDSIQGTGKHIVERFFVVGDNKNLVKIKNRSKLCSC